VSPPPQGDEFAKAVALARAGQLADAERICRAVLFADPLHFGSQYLLGVIALQRGQFQTAEQQFALALALNPNAAPAHRDRGLALAQLGRPVEALESYDKAIALRSDHAVTYFNRSLTLNDLGRLDEALAGYERAIAIRPDYAAAFNKRAMVLWTLNRRDEALASYDKAIALNPDRADAFYNRGVALEDFGRAREAVESYDRAIALAPGFAEALNNRGNALKQLDRLEEALESYDKAVAAKPDFAEGHYNRGVALFDLKRPEEALASYERAIALRPDFPEALFSRGACKLALGRVERGAWSDFENRWRLRNYPAPGGKTEAPLWVGEDLAGRSILVYAELGNGDIIQFSRFVPLLAERGAEVSFLVPERLLRLLAGLPGNIRLCTSPESKRFDFQCAVMSLPSYLDTELADIPLSIPYLAVDQMRASRWRDALGPLGFKIGIAWQGAPWNGGISMIERSVPLRAFQPLSQIPGVRLISLQKNHGLEELADLPTGMNVETLGEDFDAGPDAFADTAAAMQHLDLVISCDTSIAHLAGALGRPAWIALKHVPEWRWMFDRSDSPWYPTLRLFRQKIRGQWSGVCDDMVKELRKRLAA
jgi:tetratricopeptide (TPR) repeat protein